MPRYVSMHTIACLTRQGAEELTARLERATAVTVRRVMVSLYDGKMLIEFEAPSREALEQWLSAEGFHNDWLIRIELDSSSGSLAAV
jgi:hypothetical protein